MVSTRAQASAPERATAQNQQGDAPNLGAGIENHPDPAVRGLGAKMDEMSKAFNAFCSRMDKKERGAPSKGSQAEISRSRGGRHERRDGAPTHRDLPRTEVASSGRAPRGLEERRGPRSQGGQEHRVREMADAPRSPQRSRRTPERRVHQQPDELRHFLNAKKATAPPPVEEKLEKVWNRVFGESSGASIPRSPFTTDVRTRALPTKFKMPNLEAYDGSADPMDHLNMFREHLSLQGLDETAMCQCFPLTLKGDARMWFYGMPAGSISTFGELATAFLSQFASSRRAEKQPWHLTRVKQGARESLRGFLSRFVSEARQIPRLSDGVKLNAFLSGLEGGSFFKHLIHKGPRTFEEAEAVARAYIAAEEANDAKRPERTEEGYRPRTSEVKRKAGDYRSPPFAARQQKHQRPEMAMRRDVPPVRLTPLNDTRTNVLMQIRGEKFLKWPMPLKNPEGGDQTKFCDFHRCGGHATEDCHSLKREIEELIKRGHLSRFLQRPAQSSGTAGEPEADPPRNRVAAGVINMVSTRPAGSDGRENAASKRPRTRSGDDVICFGKEDMAHVTSPHSDPLVVTALVSDGVNDFHLKRVFVDNGSSRNLLYLDAYQKLGLKRDQMKAPEGPLYGLDNEPVPVQGIVQLEVTLGTYPRAASRVLAFLVVDLPSVYNAILGRPCLATFGAVTSIPHLKMKFPTPFGIGEVLGEQSVGRTCYLSQVTRTPLPQPMEDLDLRDEATLQQAQAGEPTVKIQLDPEDPERCVQIGSSLAESVRDSLTTLLKENSDVFAWSPADMPGISPETIVHRLGVDPHHKPVRQKRRNYSTEKLVAIREEVKKLLDAGFIREVQYPDWLSNVVMVKKNSGKWRMCVDFTDLNKACPKDSFPLPRVDRLVDSTSGYELLSFMDAYSGYNQIKMHQEDEEHTSFMTDQGTYCYRVMPFGLKNAGATYQRLVNKVFEEQIGRNVEVYVDDMLVKSVIGGSHAEDLAETFRVLREHGMKLNPSKCTFGVSSGKFLGFIVSQRGIEANPEKIQAILNMQSPRTVKEVQRLTGRVAALSRFLAKSAEKHLPFFKALRGPKTQGFRWSNECEEAFRGLKAYLANPPLLASPLPGEELYLYLSVTDQALGSVLVRQHQGDQRPVYYVSKTLADSETRYPHTEKVALTLVYSARKLRPYFQAHKIVVLTDQPLRAILQKPEISGRLIKWAIELGEFDIEFRPRPTIRGQALADFMVETTALRDNNSESSGAEGAEVIPVWTLHVDGSSMKDGCGAGVVLRTPMGSEIKYSVTLGFPATNNEAEYEALLTGLRLAKECSARSLAVYSDSELIVNQVLGNFEVNSPKLSKYLAKVKELSSGFEQLEFVHIPREENEKADALAKAAAAGDQGQYARGMREILGRPSIEEPEAEVMQVSGNDTWMTAYLKYLTNGVLPEDTAEAKKIKKSAGWYTVVDGRLYRRGYSSPYLRCLTPGEAEYALQEVHLGICGSHIGGKNLAFKIMRQGYYWPTMKHDAMDFVRRCENCQVHGTLVRQPHAELRALQSPWPFAQWGLDILGPFPMASAQRKFLIVGIDYFTKWVEATPLARITERNATEFLRQSIVCRFGVPECIITDNGTQFTGKQFSRYCSSLRINLIHASVAYPQANGQVEVTNRTILHGLKTKLTDSGGSWVDELPSILWSYRTTAREPTRETPFSLCYGVEAVIPIEVGLPSLRVEHFDPSVNSHKLREHLDLLEETRNRAQLCVAAYQQRVARYYNKKVRARHFEVGDLVLRSIAATGKMSGRNKLSPTWEGPFLVSAVLQSGAYKLRNQEGNLIPRTWNATHLKKYYQ